MNSAGDKAEHLLKCPREHVLILCVETTRCADVLARLLNLLSSEKLVPADITVERGTTRQWIGVHFDPLEHHLPERMIGRIARMPAVGNVALIDYATRSRFAPDGTIGQGFVATAFLLEEVRRARHRQIMGVTVATAGALPSQLR